MNKSRPWTTLQKIAFIFGILLLINFAQGIIAAITQRNWNALFNKLTTLIVLGIIAFILWDNIKKGWTSLLQRREASREEFEKSKGNINIKDAAIFSLAWSREIYRGIPEDRKPLVKTSFILIGIALAIVMLYLGRYGFLTVALIAGLILAGVNLLIWVVGTEREEKDRIAIELDTARRMQLSLMPANDPEVSGFDISGCCIPAQNVGGDLFDFVWIGKDHKKLCIPVVDVSGKGMDAALTAVYTSGALVTETQHEEDMVTVMDNLNSAIYSRQNRSRFVSMLMTALDVNNRRIEYINAGQSKPILVKDNRVSVLKSEGARFPLGVMKEPEYQPRDIQLKPGDSLLLYTDGVTEAMNEAQDMYGETRLTGLFMDLVQQGLGAKAMVTTVKDAVLRFSGPEHQHDDLTIVVIKAI
jgi:serine phosphatase RsbU (regulator of sigma subunit)